MKILIVEDDESQGKALEEILRKKGFIVKYTPSYQNALYFFRKGYRTCLIDLKMPEIDGITLMEKMKEEGEGNFILITAHGTVETAVSALKKGALDYILKPIDIDRLIHILKQIEEKEKMQREIEVLREKIKSFEKEEFIVINPLMKDIFLKAKKVAKSSATVLITGETGVGKEILAKFIHRESGRKGSFIAISCTAIPSELLEAEFFGYEKGAFTSAEKTKRGKVELADKGTLFLDEVGDLPFNLQAKLLRFLQEKQFERLGGLESIEVDVRIIAATNKNLEKMVKEGKFREDLFYRLNVINFEIPPLRERREEILPLFEFYLDKFSKKYHLKKPVLSEKVKKKILNYSFPGNIRELSNIAERLVLLHSGEKIDDIEWLSFQKEEFFSTKLEDMEKKHIEKVMKIAKYNITKASELLGIHRNTLREKLKKYNISYQSRD